MFETVHAERLIKLADHLDNGKLGHLIFNYCVVSDGCGGVGCAWGEIPTVWPDVFHLVKGVYFSYPALKENDRYFSQDVCKFLGINQREKKYLFFPGEENPLNADASRNQVATHIRQFVEQKGFKATQARLAKPKAMEELEMVPLSHQAQ